MNNLHSALYDLVNDADLILAAYQELALEAKSNILAILNHRLEALVQALDTLMRTN